jgi:hypothetical protein
MEIRLDVIEHHYDDQQHTNNYIIKGHIPLYALRLEDINLWYKKFLKDLKSYSDYNTEAFEMKYPEHIRGTVYDGIEKYVVENLDIKDILRHFVDSNAVLEVIDSSTHLYSGTLGFEVEVVNKHPF